MPQVPDRTTFDPSLNVHLHTGQNARDMAMTFGGRHLATDIETPGLDEAFTINCVTMCWEVQDETHAILLDPLRVDGDRYAVTEMYRKATMIILHNAPFDLPALVHHKLLEMSDISRVVDTLVLARYGWPDQLVPKGLGALAERHLGMADNADGMKLAFKAAGYRTHEEGYRRMDIDSPIYRQGAMLDTVATLRLHPILREHCWAWSLEHPFEYYGATSHGEAEALLETQEMVHRLMLRCTSKGLAVDRDYLLRYAESVQQERLLAEAELATHGLEGGVGKGAKLIEYLAETGELPDGWPRTPKGKLRAQKEDLENLDHPLAKAQRALADTEKTMGYLVKVDRQAEVTGRCHPQVGTLAASSTGRMSYSFPELQQFPAPARQVLISDDPHAADRVKIHYKADGKIDYTECIDPGTQLWSIDWSQIEPVTMGVMAKDNQFLAPYEAGEDLYEPLMRAAGIDRPTAKIVLLADMYGQGEAGMAKRIGSSIEQAGQIRRQIRAAMPLCTRWMAQVQGIAAQYGKIVTAGGRILPVDAGGVFKAVNYCLSPHTLILRSDLTHVRADSIRVGDRVVAFDEHPQREGDNLRKYRQMRTAVVEAASTVVKPTVVVHTDDGLKTGCSDDHLWLVRPTRRRKGQPTLQWRRAIDLIPGDEVLSVGRWQTDTSRTAGYVAGLLDGEGHLTCNNPGQRRSCQVTFSQLAGPVTDAYLKAMAELGLHATHRERTPSSTSPTDAVTTSGVRNVMRLVGTVRPERFIARSESIYEGRAITAGLTAPVKVTGVALIGETTLTSIQTSTRTLIANGYLSHNCVQGSAYDVLAHAIREIERAGMGDLIRLAMHDEIVLDATEEEAIAVQEIMMTPPPFFEKWLGRPPVLRTDRAPMGAAWLKV